jgi:hypothetical protein
VADQLPAHAGKPRFKQGNNANPRGRKKGSRNRKVVIHDVLFEAVTVREGGEIRQMSALQCRVRSVSKKCVHASILIRFRSSLAF